MPDTDADTNDAGNIEWSRIPKGWKVVDTGHSYVAVDPNGKRFLVTWDSRSSRYAQRCLKAWATRGTR